MSDLEKTSDAEYRKALDRCTSPDQKELVTALHREIMRLFLTERPPEKERTKFNLRVSD